MTAGYRHDDNRKEPAELTQLADEALTQPAGMRNRARCPGLCGLPDVREGRNWEIPNVVLGDSLISDVDRA